MNQILYSEKDVNSANNERKSNKKLIIAIVVLLIIAISVMLIIKGQLNNKILANVYIGDIDVGLKSKEDAITLIRPKIDNFNDNIIRLNLNDKYIDINAECVGFGLENNINEIIENAYSYGRKGNFFSNTSSVVSSYFKDTVIIPTYKLDGEKLKEVLKELAKDNNLIAEDDKYVIKEDTIYITKGVDGIKIDETLAQEYIITAFINNIESVSIPTVQKDSQKIDLDKIYDEIYIAPQNASVSRTEEFKVISDVPGKYFNLADTKEKYEALKPNETLIVAIESLEADVKVTDLEDELFSNVLASYITTYDETDKDRVQNLKVAAQRCNMILYPGDEFSYNKALGTRTIANGFAPGHSFAGGRVVTTIGGGICQVSSTLYNVVLMADLEVTNRIAHGMYVEYVKPSLDATVVDGAIDFKFKNNRKYPVKIEASAENGIVTVSLLGIKDKNEPIIEIESVILETLAYKTIRENDSTMKKGTSKVVQEPVNGYRSEAYKIVKDAEGNEISRTLISKDRYIPTNEIIKVGTKEDIVIITPVEPEIIEPTPSVPDVIINEEKEEERDLPEGWDLPESPYSH